jgi:hypothetical protein
VGIFLSLCGSRKPRKTISSRREGIKKREIGNTIITHMSVLRTCMVKKPEQNPIGRATAIYMRKITTLKRMSDPFGKVIKPRFTSMRRLARKNLHMVCSNVHIVVVAGYGRKGYRFKQKIRKC